MRDRIRDFVLRELRWTGPPEQLTDDFGLIESDVMDSMGLFQMVAFIESDLGIEIHDDELVPENFASVGAISALLAAKQRSSLTS